MHNMQDDLYHTEHKKSFTQKQAMCKTSEHHSHHDINQAPNLDITTNTCDNMKFDKRMNEMSNPPFWGVFRRVFGVRS